MKSPRSGRWNWKCSETELARRRSRMTRDAVGARAVSLFGALDHRVRVTVFKSMFLIRHPARKTKSGDRSDANERHMRFAPEVLPFRRTVTTNRDIAILPDMPRASPAHRPRAATARVSSCASRAPWHAPSPLCVLQPITVRFTRRPLRRPSRAVARSRDARRAARAAATANATGGGGSERRRHRLRRLRT